jgi:hypothetical protein
MDNNPCPHSQVDSIPGPRRCPGACESRKDEFYNFETKGESLFEHGRRVNAEWDAERKKREEERKKKEAATTAYSMSTPHMKYGKPQLLLKNYAENDDRCGKRFKWEEDTDVAIKTEETDEVEMGGDGHDGDDEGEMKIEEVD